MTGQDGLCGRSVVGYVLTGQAVGLREKYPLPGVAGSYALTGQTVGFVGHRLVAIAAGYYSIFQPNEGYGVLGAIGPAGPIDAESEGSVLDFVAIGGPLDGVVTKEK